MLSDSSRYCLHADTFPFAGNPRGSCNAIRWLAGTPTWTRPACTTGCLFTFLDYAGRAFLLYQFWRHFFNLFFLQAASKNREQRCRKWLINFRISTETFNVRYRIAYYIRVVNLKFHNINYKQTFTISLPYEEKILRNALKVSESQSIRSKS